MRCLSGRNQNRNLSRWSGYLRVQVMYSSKQYSSAAAWRVVAVVGVAKIGLATSVPDCYSLLYLLLRSSTFAVKTECVSLWTDPRETPTIWKVTQWAMTRARHDHSRRSPLSSSGIQVILPCTMARPRTKSTPAPCTETPNGALP